MNGKSIMSKNEINKALSETEIKEELTKMLSTVDQYMSENNFQYTIFAGTLLGAVRHRGFIPWDDDVDIAMLRPEYERLLNKLRDNPVIRDNIIAVGFELENGDLPYIKIVNKKIKTEEYISSYSSQQGYLWIDVFPLDGIPTNNVNGYYKKLHQLESNYLGKRIYINKWIICSPKERNPINRFKMFLKYAAINYSALTSRFINFAKKYDVDMNGEVSNNIWGIGYKEAFPARYMTEMIEYKFENIKVKGMKEADKWLHVRYGDYMKLPKQDERINHGLKAWAIAD